MMEFEEDRAPQVISMKNIMLALGLHVAVFLVFWVFSKINFKPKESVMPIELVIEAPPDEIAPDEVKPPEPEPPKATPKPPEPPPVVDEKVDAVVRVKEEKKPDKKKKPDPPKDKPKPPEQEKPKEEKPKEKTKEQIKREKEAARKKRLEEMRKGAKVVKDPKPPPVVGTGQKLDPNWEKRLKEGYKPSDHTELARDEKQRCVSLIKAAFYEKWDRPPWTDTLRRMELRVWFGPGGRVVRYKLIRGSTDARADATVVNAAKAVRYVPGLSDSFIKDTRDEGVVVRFDVTPQ